MRWTVLWVYLFSMPAMAEGPVWPPGPQAHNPAWSLRLGTAHASGLVPEFRAAERSRTATGLALAWDPEGPARVDLHWDYLVETTALGDRHSGPGDVRLGTDLQLLDLRADLYLGWQVKLPNAGDELELGTDETDSSIWLRTRSELGQVELGLVGGLAIIGNPLQFANQDDVPLTWLDLSVPAGRVRFDARVGGGWQTSRNPARMEASVGVEGACPWLVGARALAGLTPAAPDWGAQVWLGWGLSCPD